MIKIIFTEKIQFDSKERYDLKKEMKVSLFEIQ